MSRTHYRAAIACRDLTGVGWGRFVAWDEQGLISRERPVPDASTADQRSFEALIVNILANALSDRQLGAAFGIASVFPAPGHITIRLHPGMASRVLWELLPRYDAAYGGVRGVPAMRMERWAGRIILRDLLSKARVDVIHPGDPRSMMHMLISPEQPLWLEGSTSLHNSEAEDRAYWAAEQGALSLAKAAGRDWLLSRMLRRPCLVNRTCRQHGWANTYTHVYEDLVIEWCCDDTPAELAHHLQRTGVTDWPDDPRLGVHRAPEPGAQGTLRLGDARVIFRRGYCSGDSPAMPGASPTGPSGTADVHRNRDHHPRHRLRRSRQALERSADRTPDPDTGQGRCPQPDPAIRDLRTPRVIARTRQPAL